MRKIEAAMLDAIRYGKNWKNSNTEVKIIHHSIYHTPSYLHEVQVLLFGNIIARFYDHDKHTVTLDPCGWHTLTTKSRMNAILSFISEYCFSGYQIASVEGEWKVFSSSPISRYAACETVPYTKPWIYATIKPEAETYTFS